MHVNMYMHERPQGRGAIMRLAHLEHLPKLFSYMGGALCYFFHVAGSLLLRLSDPYGGPFHHVGAFLNFFSLCRDFFLGLPPNKNVFACVHVYMEAGQECCLSLLTCISQYEC